MDLWADLGDGADELVSGNPREQLRTAVHVAVHVVQHGEPDPAGLHANQHLTAPGGSASAPSRGTARRPTRAGPGPASCPRREVRVAPLLELGVLVGHEIRARLAE